MNTTINTINLISFPEVNFDKTYLISQNKKSHIGSFGDQNKIQIEVRVRVLERQQKNTLCRIETLNRTHTGNHPIHNLEAMIQGTKKRMDVEVNDKGAIISILNLKVIGERWKRLYHTKLRDFREIENGQKLINYANELVQDKKLFESTLIESDIPQILFPPIYNQQEDEFKQPREVIFPAVFGQFDLPILKNTAITKSDDQMTEIRSNGIVNEKKYKEKEVRKMLKILFDKYNVPSKLNLKYHDITELDQNNTVKFAGQILFAGIPSYIFTQNITHLKPLNLTIK